VIELEFHPIADVFPLIEGEAFDALVADIKVIGLGEPIVLFEDKILDGRNRYRACLAAGVKPRFERYVRSDPVRFVTSKNLIRRHLDESQRAMVAAKLATLTHGGDRANLPLEVPTQAQAADLLNVSERSVRDARKVLDHGTPDQVQDVEAGKVAVSAAAKQVRAARKPAAPAPEYIPTPAVQSPDELVEPKEDPAPRSGRVVELQVGDVIVWPEGCDLGYTAGYSTPERVVENKKESEARSERYEKARKKYQKAKHLFDIEQATDAVRNADAESIRGASKQFVDAWCRLYPRARAPEARAELKKRLSATGTAPTTQPTAVARASVAALNHNQENHRECSKATSPRT
jgi:hypothetical protein